MPDISRNALVSLPDLAAYLRLSPRTLRRYVKNGDLRSVPVGGRPAVPWSEVWRLVDLHPPRGAEASYRLPLMTPEEVAAVCGASAGRIKMLARRGELPGRRLAKAWRFAPAEVEAWLIARATAAKTAP